jgi:hypothetical protein
MPAPAEITKRLRLLSAFGKPELSAEWQRLFSRPAPEALRKDLMLRVLAYRIQEVAFGGLKPATRKRLQQLAKAIAENPRAPVSPAPSIKPGTRLVREWNGKPNVVTVLEEGFEYSGKRYGSLSEIARLITGTRWSGPLFFGLKSNRAKERVRG